MLDCLAAHAHRLRVLIETLLHRFEHVLVVPSRDSPLGPCRTPGFERAARACRRPVAAQRLAVLLVRITIGQLLARRAATIVVYRRKRFSPARNEPGRGFRPKLCAGLCARWGRLCGAPIWTAG